MLMVLTASCVLLGWKVHKVHQQKMAVAWVRSMGGHVAYDYENGELGVALPNATPGPKWLRDTIGVEYVATIDYVDLSSTKVTDLSPLLDLPQLKTLWLRDTKVHDLSALKHLDVLEALDLGNTQVRNVDALTVLSRLTYLNLSNTPVRDLSSLAHLTNLESLFVRQTGISDVTPLKGLAKLKLIVLDHTCVTEAVLAELRGALPTCIVLGDADNVETE